MNEVLPLLLFPAVLGWWVAELKRRRTRHGLQEAIARTHRPILADAGRASVIAVARSLETAQAAAPADCPWWRVGRARRIWEIRQLVAPLGLELTSVIGIRRDRLGRHTGFTGASRFAGVRHGRHVAVELAVASSEIVVELPPTAAIPDLALDVDRDGRLHPAGPVPAALAAALQTLAPSRHWRGLTLAGEGTQIKLTRATESAASWLHDLWLAEFVADLAAPVAAPHRAAGSEPLGAPVDAAAALPAGA